LARKNKVLTGTSAKINITNPNGTITTTTIVPLSGTSYSFSGAVPIATSGHLWTTAVVMDVDPLAHWGPHAIRKLRMGPFLEFMRLLRTFDLVDNEHLRELEGRFKTYNSLHRKKRETPPNNSYLKHIKERFKKKGKARRT
jgi:hypothetical protein